MINYEQIKLICLDVDGTLTDCSIAYTSGGEEIKVFNGKDGMGINLGKKAGLRFCVITGRYSQITTRRMKELGINTIHQGIHNKKEVLDKVLNDLNLTYDNVCYIGDDINDMEVMKLSYFAACPNDSAKDILNIADYVSDFGGGKGAVRDVIELILRNTLDFDEFITNNYNANVQQ